MSGEDVAAMHAAGQTDSQIIASMRKQGKSPQEIQDALQRAQLTESTSGENPGMAGMQKTIMAQNDGYGTAGGGYTTPQTQEYSNYDQTAYQNQGAPQEYNTQGYDQTQQTYQNQGGYDQTYQDQGGYDQSAYGYGTQGGYDQASQDQGGYDQSAYGYGATDTGMMMEVAEQVAEEKFGELRKELHEMKEFKAVTAAQLENLNERVKRIETSMDKLQAAILDRIGQYGSSVNAIKSEMRMMQDSFAKTLGEKGHSPRKSHK